MNRWMTHARADRSAFTHTAMRTHRVNINPKIPRGGIRL